MLLNFLQAKQEFGPWINNGTCDDALKGQVLNAVAQRVFEFGKFVGMVQRIAFCHQSSCITLPYNVESVLEMSGPCGQPVNIRNSWYEFLPGGPWQQERCNKWADLTVPRGIVCTAYDICGSKYIRVYADLPEADDAQILIQGLDENGFRVRTLVDGVWIDGELIDLINGSPQLSTKLWTKIESVQKPLTTGTVQIYMVDPDDTATNQGLLAIYQPSETIPNYQRLYMPCLCASGDHPKHIVLLVKMKYVPMVLDTDLFPITSYSAVMFLCQSMYFWGVENPQLAEIMEKKGLQALNNELKQALGGAQAVPRIKFAGFSNRPIAYQPR